MICIRSIWVLTIITICRCTILLCVDGCLLCFLLDNFFIRFSLIFLFLSSRIKAFSPGLVPRILLNRFIVRGSPVLNHTTAALQRASYDPFKPKLILFPTIYLEMTELKISTLLLSLSCSKLLAFQLICFNTFYNFS